jgi:hypothetical protein
MSTKTVTKRVALATVVALGAGILSLVSVSSASAANNASAGSAGPLAASNVLNIATLNSTNGSVVVPTNANGTADGASVGLLSVGSVVSGDKTAGTTQTATILSTGTLEVYTTTTNGNLITVSGGTISASTGTALSADLTKAGSTNGSALFVTSIKPNSGVTSFTVSLYTKGATTGADLVSGVASGTLYGYITVSVAASSVSGTLSTSKSAIYYEAAGATTQGLSTDDTTGTPGKSDWATAQYANIAAKDAYGVALAAGLLTASATNGAYVGLAGNAAATANQSTAYYTAATPNDTILTVKAPSSAPVTTTVTISYNGTVLGTKAFTFTGSVNKIVLNGAANGKTSNSTSNTASITFYDAGGNTVYLTGTNTPVANFVADSASYGGIVTATSLSTAPSNSSTPGLITFTCGPNAGTTNLDVKYTNNDGTVIISNALPVTCSGAAVSYSAAYDKSSYNLGDIATLVITFKDSKGNLANDVDAVATTVASVTSSGLGATAVTGPVAGDLPTNGVIKYKYTVGNTASATGTFTNSIDFSTVDTRATNAGLSQAAVTASFTVNSSGTSLNDVLKGIVSLIASINKQIAALAKLVSKK